MILFAIGRVLGVVPNSSCAFSYSATPSVLQSSLVFSQHFPRALSRHKCTRLVFFFLIEVLLNLNTIYLVCNILEIIIRTAKPGLYKIFFFLAVGMHTQKISCKIICLLEVLRLKVIAGYLSKTLKVSCTVCGLVLLRNNYKKHLKLIYKRKL